MPIVYVHGVATRETALDPIILGLMKGYLSNVLTPGRDVDVVYAYWGDVGAQFAWAGRSRPRSPLLSMGASGRSEAGPVLMAELAEPLAALPVPRPPGRQVAIGGLVPAGPGSAHTAAPHDRLKDLQPDALSDLLVTVLIASPDTSVSALIAADEVAHDPSTAAALAASRDVTEEWAYLSQAIDDRTKDPLVSQGASRLLRFRDRVTEALDRGAGVPGYVASRMVAEVRGPANTLATMFIGDVFEYLNHRGTIDEVGTIPDRFLSALHEATDTAAPGEPVVVVTHSMGGQIVYDAITTFLPQIAEHQRLRVDFWCATASQVGLFEELKLFLASSPNHHTGTPAPFPDKRHLGAWWNVWDHNDFLSYTVRGIVADVDDEPFDSGMGLSTAHSGYLHRPSFYRRLASKLSTANSANWGR